jgi:hypothetical protein
MAPTKVRVPIRKSSLSLRAQRALHEALEAMRVQGTSASPTQTPSNLQLRAVAAARAKEAAKARPRALLAASARRAT